MKNKLKTLPVLICKLIEKDKNNGLKTVAFKTEDISLVEDVMSAVFSNPSYVIYEGYLIITKEITQITDLN